MAPPRIRKAFSGFAPDLQIHLKRPCIFFAFEIQTVTLCFLFLIRGSLLLSHYRCSHIIGSEEFSTDLFTMCDDVKEIEMIELQWTQFSELQLWLIHLASQRRLSDAKHWLCWGENSQKSPIYSVIAHENSHWLGDGGG